MLLDVFTVTFFFLTMPITGIYVISESVRSNIPLLVALILYVTSFDLSFILLNMRHTFEPSTISISLNVGRDMLKSPNPPVDFILTRKRASSPTFILLGISNVSEMSSSFTV